MKKQISRLMRFCAWLGGAAAVLTVLTGISMVMGLLLTDTAQAARTPAMVWNMFPNGLRIMGFTVSTALAAVILSFPLSWALSVLICFVAPHRWREKLKGVVNGFSAVPAVVFGYMSLSYIAPSMESPWWAVVYTLVLMSLMRQTLALVRVNERCTPLVEAGDAMGAYICETVLQLVLKQAARGYLAVGLRMLARALSEGVAILMVLSYYSGSADTLSTALMRALGVTGENANAQWVLLLAVLLLILVLLSNSLISAAVQGGRHGKKNA